MPHEIVQVLPTTPVPAEHASHKRDMSINAATATTVTTLVASVQIAHSRNHRGVVRERWWPRAQAKTGLTKAV